MPGKMETGRYRLNEIFIRLGVKNLTENTDPRGNSRK